MGGGGGWEEGRERERGREEERERERERERGREGGWRDLKFGILTIDYLFVQYQLSIIDREIIFIANVIAPMCHIYPGVFTSVVIYSYEFPYLLIKDEGESPTLA